MTNQIICFIAWMVIGITMSFLLFFPSWSSINDDVLYENYTCNQGVSFEGKIKNELIAKSSYRYDNEAVNLLSSNELSVNVSDPTTLSSTNDNILNSNLNIGEATETSINNYAVNSQHIKISKSRADNYSSNYLKENKSYSYSNSSNNSNQLYHNSSSYSSFSRGDIYFSKNNREVIKKSNYNDYAQMSTDLSGSEFLFGQNNEPQRGDGASGPGGGLEEEIPVGDGVWFLIVCLFGFAAKKRLSV